MNLMVVIAGDKNYGSYVFANSTNLKEIKFAPNLQTLHIGIFENCTNLETINFN